jgi:hypothetical protein
MSRDEKGYNGWANYETWRVMLEMFDGYDPDGQWMTRDAVEEMADELLTMDLPNPSSCLALDYARAFLSAVDWREIAAAINKTWETPNPDATDENEVHGADIDARFSEDN